MWGSAHLCPAAAAGRAGKSYEHAGNLRCRCAADLPDGSCAPPPAPSRCKSSPTLALQPLLKLGPAQRVRYSSLLEPAAARLVDAIAHEAEWSTLCAAVV